MQRSDLMTYPCRKCTKEVGRACGIGTIGGQPILLQHSQIIAMLPLHTRVKVFLTWQNRKALELVGSPFPCEFDW